MKNRMKIMKCMHKNQEQQRFSVDDLIKGTSLKKSQIDYEIKLMVNNDIVNKVNDMKDLRRSYYMKGREFSGEWKKFFDL